MNIESNMNILCITVEAAELEFNNHLPGGIGEKSKATSEHIVFPCENLTVV